MEHNSDALSIKFSALFCSDPTPTPRQGHVATIYNGYYYVFGGNTII
jgi:hypothetical protein